MRKFKELYGISHKVFHFLRFNVRRILIIHDGNIVKRVGDGSNHDCYFKRSQ